MTTRDQAIAFLRGVKDGRGPQTIYQDVIEHALAALDEATERVSGLEELLEAAATRNHCMYGPAVEHDRGACLGCHLNRLVQILKTPQSFSDEPQRPMALLMSEQEATDMFALSHEGAVHLALRWDDLRMAAKAVADCFTDRPPKGDEYIMQAAPDEVLAKKIVKLRVVIGAIR
jgi:hypothetical protein